MSTNRKITEYLIDVYLDQLVSESEETRLG